MRTVGYILLCVVAEPLRPVASEPRYFQLKHFSRSLKIFILRFSQRREGQRWYSYNSPESFLEALGYNLDGELGFRVNCWWYSPAQLLFPGVMGPMTISFCHTTILGYFEWVFYIHFSQSLQTISGILLRLGQNHFRFNYFHFINNPTIRRYIVDIFRAS